MLDFFFWLMDKQPRGYREKGGLDENFMGRQRVIVNRSYPTIYPFRQRFSSAGLELKEDILTHALIAHADRS